MKSYQLGDDKPPVAWSELVKYDKGHVLDLMNEISFIHNSVSKCKGRKDVFAIPLYCVKNFFVTSCVNIVFIV